MKYKLGRCILNQSVILIGNYVRSVLLGTTLEIRHVVVDFEEVAKQGVSLHR